MSNQISNKGCADFALVTDWTNLLCNWICWEVVRIDVVQKPRVVDVGKKIGLGNNLKYHMYKALVLSSTLAMTN